MKIFIRYSLLLLAIIFTNSTQADIRYNDVTQKSSHNSYQRDEGILDQLVFHKARSIEFDIHSGKIGRAGLSDDWYVYHHSFDRGTNCDQLKQCMNELKIFDAQQPDHDIVTVWFDIKEGFDSVHSQILFDQVITQHINVDDILKPSDLYSACPGATSLKDTVTGVCDWPTLDELKGKWIFVVTNSGYGTNRPDRLAFIAHGGVSQNSDINGSNRIFFNTSTDNSSVHNYIYSENFVSRRYYLNNEGDFNHAIAVKTHHLATDKINVNADPWSRTHNGIGGPYRCLNNECIGYREDDNIISIRVNSEDIWNNDDHFTFLNQDRGTQNGRWISAINVTSSHVDRWAKACIMARASTSSNSPYFAICRPSDNGRIATQWRDSYGGGSDSQDANVNGVNGIAQEDLTYVKMDIYNNGRCAAGFASHDGVSWTSVASRCFNDTLKLQGIGASSHGNHEVKHMFSNLSNWGQQQTRNNFTQSNIGTVRFAQAFDGSFKSPSAQEFYDLGTSNSAIFGGYTRVTHNTKALTTGYGWLNTNSIDSRDRGTSNGQNSINRDIIFSSQARTFEQAVENGPWYVMVTFGDTYPHDDQAIEFEGYPREDNISTVANEYRNIFFSGVVIDGALSITFRDNGGTDPNWAITRIVIQDEPFFPGQALQIDL